ncbi:MAG: cytochrome C [Pseudomonadota bacterium]
MGQARRHGCIGRALQGLTLVFLAVPGQTSTPSDGAALERQYCASCHGVDLLEQSSGYTGAHWGALIDSMINLDAVPTERAALLSYLEQQYPPNQRRTPRLVDGEVAISFDAWAAPTLGQRVRDPAQAPDGKIWWAGQYGNLVGSIDPVTGALREYGLPPGAHPHTVTVDDHNQVWYTGNRNGTIGRLDPATGEVTEFPLPDSAALDPHSAVFDQRGRLFFTVQRSNFIGRLDPSTGVIELAKVATPNALPYGIKIDAAGIPWVACYGSNCLIRVDPESLALEEVTLPDVNARVRRLDIASDGAIWYVNSSLGRLGRYNPEDGKFREWPAPSGASAHPYAIAIIDDVVWFNESGMRPDTLVRFDPSSETFQSWPIPSGDVYSGIVRHMRPTEDGDLLIHQSASNRVLRVSVAPADGT